ncbi:hypothetical protein [Dietzia natronolimnaea]|uniref:hypothetical protein n=1 Tax=Dietzia natronolimnaea TaxID=161920 RepID=UPI0015F8BD30|nr:hypothetical protein [Dietzia natronolimnaea]MBB1038842.1 hypothetical protein [Dietzia natronolimnaea]
MTDGAPDRRAQDSSAPITSAPITSASYSSARIDDVFGETLPRTTSDEARDLDARLGDDWWREQRPPHHG